MCWILSLGGIREIPRDGEVVRVGCEPLTLTWITTLKGGGLWLTLMLDGFSNINLAYDLGRAWRVSFTI